MPPSIPPQTNSNPSLFPSILSGGAGIVGGALNALFAGHRNRQSQRWSAQQWERENREMWRMWHAQNTYNDPKNQAARLEAAGYNKLLPFLKGGSGTQPAASMSVPSAKNVDFKTPDMSGASLQLGNSIDKMYDLEKSKLHTNNLARQNDLIAAQAFKTTMDAAMSKAKTARSKYDLSFAKKIESMSLEKYEEETRKAKLDNWISLNQEDRNAVLHSKTIEEAVERITMQKIQQTLGNKKAKEYDQTLRNLVKQGEILDFEIALNATGQTKNDAFLYRVAGIAVANALKELGLEWMLEGVDAQQRLKN